HPPGPLPQITALLTATAEVVTCVFQSYQLSPPAVSWLTTQYVVPAAKVTAVLKLPYWNWPAVPPLMLMATAPPGTSCPSLVLTSFTVCDALFPGPIIRPSLVTVSGLAPTTICIPTHPL